MATEIIEKPVVGPADEDTEHFAICSLTLPDLQGKIYFSKEAVTELVEHNADSKVAVVPCRHVYSRFPLIRGSFCKATLSPGYIMAIQLPTGKYQHVLSEELDEIIAAMGAYLEPRG